MAGMEADADARVGFSATMAWSSSPCLSRAGWLDHHHQVASGVSAPSRSTESYAESHITAPACMNAPAPAPAAGGERKRDTLTKT